jgi:hypothetical protein
MDGVITTGKKNPVSGNSGTLGQEIASGFVYRRGILPTPTSFDRKTCKQTVSGWTVTRPSGETFMAGLRMLAYNGLLPTPTTQEIAHPDAEISSTGRRLPKSDGGATHSMGLADLAHHKMLPTPEANNYKNGHRTISPRIERKLEQGWAVGLNDRATLGLLPTPLASQATHGGPNQRDSSGRPGLQMAAMAMLPTPTTSSRNGGTAKEREDGVSRRSELNHLVAQDFGTASQLSPLFVEEMMGFPRYWILLPFLRESPVPREPSPSSVGEQNP